MPKQRKKGLPKKVFIYVCDYDEKSGEPYYAVLTTVNDLPEDQEGEKVGEYSLEEVGVFRINRHIQKP